MITVAAAVDFGTGKGQNDSFSPVFQGLQAEWWLWVAGRSLSSVKMRRRRIGQAMDASDVTSTAAPAGLLLDGLECTTARPKPCLVLCPSAG